MGAAVGFKLGKRVGDAVGKTEGSNEGAKDGGATGAIVGTLEGVPMGALEGNSVGICVGAEEGWPDGESDIDGGAVGCIVGRVFPITGFGLRLPSNGLKNPFFFFPLSHFHFSSFMCFPLFDFLLPFLFLLEDLPPLFFFPEPLYFLLLYDFNVLFDFIDGVLLSQNLLPRRRLLTRSVLEQPQSSSICSPLDKRLIFCACEHPFCFPLVLCFPLASIPDFLFDVGKVAEVDRHFLLPRITLSTCSALVQPQSYFIPFRREFTI